MPSNLTAEDDAAIAWTQTYHEPIYWMALNEAQCRLLLQGIIDEPVRAMARCLVDWDFDLKVETERRRRADARRMKGGRP